MIGGEQAPEHVMRAHAPLTTPDRHLYGAV